MLHCVRFRHLLTIFGTRSSVTHLHALLKARAFNFVAPDVVLFVGTLQSRM
jgi:hypothetical protein